MKQGNVERDEYVILKLSEDVSLKQVQLWPLHCTTKNEFFLIPKVLLPRGRGRDDQHCWGRAQARSSKMQMLIRLSARSVYLPQWTNGILLNPTVHSGDLGVKKITQTHDFSQRLLYVSFFVIAYFGIRSLLCR